MPLASNSPIPATLRLCAQEFDAENKPVAGNLPETSLEGKGQSPAKSSSHEVESVSLRAAGLHSSSRWERRKEIAECSLEIAKAVQAWLQLVPWRVRVLYDGQDMLCRLRADEVALPWPSMESVWLHQEPRRGGWNQAVSDVEHERSVFGPNGDASPDESKSDGSVLFDAVQLE